MRKRNILRFSILTIVLLLIAVVTFRELNFNSHRTVGEKLDSLDGVFVYYNGGVGHSEGRNLAPDGYNIGLKYQCVEFVKRYYYVHYNHRMPDAYGNAKDFFDTKIIDGGINQKRNLYQYTNPSIARPEKGDLLIYAPEVWNPYGHVAIVASVGEDAMEIIQQNPGPYGRSREVYSLREENGNWKIDNNRIWGWLRK
ncbi:MAG: CHAP domain-containing protein [Sphingobacterium sp.]|jgi:surface antigen|nr:CHAP domain-containing protein [Sphingobacterium sp.]